MADPFSGKNEDDRKAAEKAARDTAKKQATASAQARMAATKIKSEEKPNSDIGYRWPKKFYEPGY